MDLLINFPQAALSLAEMMVNDEKSLLLFLRTFQAIATCAKFFLFLVSYFINFCTYMRWLGDNITLRLQ